MILQNHDHQYLFEVEKLFQILIFEKYYHRKVFDFQRFFQLKKKFL